MKISSVVFALLTRALLGDLSLAINVTITPSPFTVAQEGQNVTLSCVVSQRRRNAALPVVKWTFLPMGADRPEDELLVARVNMRKARFYGNYTKSFPWPKLKLSVVKQGKIFDLVVLNVSEGDRGLYVCRVQEFRKHQDRWKASSNCTATTELRAFQRAVAFLGGVVHCPSLGRGRRVAPTVPRAVDFGPDTESPSQNVEQTRVPERLWNET
ncbi:V-set and transmembrane domain-containing protein 4 [Liparis tanakae]|uniref:V-set and transmembrane domain-containing protein 4 n=1 Tax=Liparis tanakae TaxID=230148 RepID=A0A4Z2F308_9TELE|nr:V-set and transmembrane domain-containing protein 4 [Liparis tanakae]